MTITAIHLNAEGQLQSCEVAHALAEAKKGAGFFWINISNYELAELESWLDRLQLSPFARNRLLKQGEITKVVPLDRGLIIDLRILPQSQAGPPTQVAVLCLKNLLIELTPESTDSAQTSRDLELMEPSTTGVLLSLMLLEAKRVSREIRAIRSRAFELDEQMDRDPGAVDLDAILEVKDRLLKLLSVAVEQLECFEALTATSSEVLDFSTLKGSTRLLLSAAGSSERMAGRVEKRITDLRQRYDAHQQEKLNHRLAVLTILSAVFLPLTLIAGIWGMNFEVMPELSLPFSYPMALTLMAVTAGVMLWFFHRRGWFD